MKKIIMVLVALCTFSMISCGKSDASSESSTETTEQSLLDVPGSLADYPLVGIIDPEQYRTSLLEGNDNNIGYEQFLDDDMFKGMMMSFTMESNPLQLASGTDKNAHISQVFKIAVTDDEKVLGLSNIWNYLVSADDRALGVIKVDCRKGMPQAYNYHSSQGIARKLNEVQEGERLAVFNDGNELDIYGIFEDGRVINLMGADPYTGSLTYSDIAAEDNIITVGGYGKQL